MKLTAKGRYAVMALADLARQRRGRPIPLADIAERQDISLSYLEQLFAKLRRAELVTSVRGPGGGYRLAYPAHEISVAAIVGAVDEPVETNRCTPSQPSGCRGGTAECVTHDLWEELGNQIYLYLAAVSLGDVVEHRVIAATPPSRTAGGRDAQPA
jgi:Rrf2 family iron-sulfur cluster assembly transcriptional regulator